MPCLADTADADYNLYPLSLYAHLCPRILPRSTSMTYIQPLSVLHCHKISHDIFPRICLLLTHLVAPDQSFLPLSRGTVRVCRVSQIPQVTLRTIKGFEILDSTGLLPLLLHPLSAVGAVARADRHDLWILKVGSVNQIREG